MIQFPKDERRNSKIVYLVLVKQGVLELLEFWKFGIAFLISTHKLKQKKVKISQDIFSWHTIHNVYLQTQVPLLIK